MSDAKGRFCWYDLMTTDPKAAVPFYTNVVGWGTTEWTAPGADMKPYTMWTNGETPLGGVMDLPDEVKQMGAPPMWLVYVLTPDINATVKRATELGGSVRNPPMDIPTVGRFAVLADPQDATFCVFEPADEPPGHDGPREVGEFSWHELATTDPDAAFKFYSDLFGWVKTGDFDMGPDGLYQMFGSSADMPMGGIFKKPEQMPVTAWLPYARVDDVHKAVERVTAGGGQVVNGPMEVPGGDFIAQGIDPQGAMFAIHSTAA